MVFIFHRMGSSFAVYSVISRKIVLKFSLTSCIFAFSYRESRNKTPISLVVHGREQVWSHPWRALLTVVINSCHGR